MEIGATMLPLHVVHGRAFAKILTHNINFETKYIYRLTQKISHYQIIKKSYYITLNPVNEIRFIRQIKE